MRFDRLFLFYSYLLNWESHINFVHTCKLYMRFLHAIFLSRHKVINTRSFMKTLNRSAKDLKLSSCHCARYLLGQYISDANWFIYIFL